MSEKLVFFFTYIGSELYRVIEVSVLDCQYRGREFVRPPPTGLKYSGNQLLPYEIHKGLEVVL